MSDSPETRLNRGRFCTFDGHLWHFGLNSCTNYGKRCYLCGGKDVRMCAADTPFIFYTPCPMSVTRIRTLACSLTFFFSTVAVTMGQTLRSVESRDGLSSMFVLSLYQDVHGFVWAGTYSGLSILDGNGATVAFADRPEVKAEAGVMVRGIDGAADGTVWLNTNFGLDCWNISTGRNEHHTEFTGRYDMAVGPRGEVVVLTLDRGFFAYNARVHRFEQLTAELVAYADCHAMTIDSVGRWRVVTRTHTLEATLSADADGHVSATQTRKIAHEAGRLTTAKADADELLMVTEDGMFCVGDASGRAARAVCQLSPQMQQRQPYSGIVRDGDDFLFAFYSGGVFRLRSTENGYVEEPTGISCGVFGLRRDSRQPIIWVATDGEGVRYFVRAPYLVHNELFAQLPFTVSAPVRAIIRDSAGTLLVGTKGDGLLCYEHYDAQQRRHAVRQLTKANSGLLHNSVYALAESSHDVVWIGSDGRGVNYYSPRTGRIGSVGSDVPHLTAIHALVEVDDRYLYACSGNGRGVFRLALEWRGDEPHVIGCKQLFYDADSPSRCQFISIVRQDDRLWMANREQGLRMLDMRTGISSLTRFPSDSLRAQNDPITVLYDASHRQLFCGTSRGLFSYRADTVASGALDIGATIGLPDATVRGMALEPGRLWVATTQGLAGRDLESGEFNVLTVRDELRVPEFGEGAAYYDPGTGEKYFGGTNGFVVVSPHQHQLSVIYPDILFTGVKVGNRYATLPGADGSGQSPLQMRHSENYLTIGFTAVDYIYFGRYTFQYRLKSSAGSEWRDLGHTRSVTFANMPPGHYCLQVRYRSARYVSPPFELPFTIRPPWYATTWARLLWLLLSAATAVALYRAVRWMRARRLRRIQQSIRQRQRMRVLREEIQQRDSEIQQRDQRLEQLKAMAAEQSPYDVVGDRVLHREDQQLLERIFQIIKERVGDPDLSPNMIADEMCMSYRTLYRKMQDISDKTLATIIRDIRMDQARGLLTQTRMTIDQVVTRVGYTNRGSFYKHFAAHFGCTPRQFQANFTAEVVPSNAEDVQSDDKTPHED